MNPYRMPVESTTDEYILVVEPNSCPTGKNISIIGPYGLFKAWIMTRWMKFKYPYGYIRMVSAQCRVTFGSEVLWDER